MTAFLSELSLISLNSFSVARRKLALCTCVVLGAVPQSLARVWGNGELHPEGLTAAGGVIH